MISPKGINEERRGGNVASLVNLGGGRLFLKTCRKEKKARPITSIITAMFCKWSSKKRKNYGGRWGVWENFRRWEFGEPPTPFKKRKKKINNVPRNPVFHPFWGGKKAEKKDPPAKEPMVLGGG